jgi:hypothetical protein
MMIAIKDMEMPIGGMHHIRQKVRKRNDAGNI